MRSVRDISVKNVYNIREFFKYYTILLTIEFPVCCALCSSSRCCASYEQYFVRIARHVVKYK